MRLKRLKCIPVLLAALLLTGCWDSTDIEDKNIVTAVIFDVKDEKYRFFAEVADIASNANNNIDASQSSSSYEKSGFTFVQSQGEDLVESRANLDLQMDKPIYLDAVRTLILTERGAKKDLKEYLFRLKADVEYRQKVKVFITHEEPEALTRSRTENDISFGFSVDNMLDQLIDNGQAFSRSSARYIENILGRSGFCIPCVDLENTSIILSGYFVVGYDADLRGFIPANETRGLVIMKADHAEQNYVVPLGGNTATIRVEIESADTSVQYDGGRMRFSVEYGVSATIEYFKNGVQSMDEETTRRIHDTLVQMIKADVKETIARSQKEFKCDYLQFDDAFRVSYPREFKEIDWEKEYPNAQMDVKINVNMDTDPRIIYEPSRE